MDLPSFSIVINTLNRAESLKNTLNSFRWIDYKGQFEVIVVNGPSSDHTEEIINSWQPLIRAYSCKEANLSVSRNIGICAARGDIVAFIDDDAIPESEWLNHLAAAYQDPYVGGAGGFVYNHTGYDFQYKFCTVDRFGNPNLTHLNDSPNLNFPFSHEIPHLLGCNSSFRRSALLEIKGFDEEYEYFLDETDVCLRLIDAGYSISQLTNAFVHHKYAPSNIRGNNKVVKNRYPIIKNKIYFMLKNSRTHYSVDRIIEEMNSFITNQKNEVKHYKELGYLTEDDVLQFEKDLENAVRVGLQRGYEGVDESGMITIDKINNYSSDFTEFNPFNNPNRINIVLISKDFPPNHGGGIATFMKDLAESLANLGHSVHLITSAQDISTVDFENGVWVHRMIINSHPESEWSSKLNIPKSIWDWSSTAKKECERIHSHCKVDVVEAPIWDCEGIALLETQNWPIVTSLQTTLLFWLQSHPEYKNDLEWMKSFGEPVKNLESFTMKNSHAIRSISNSIATEIESAYDFKFCSSRLIVSHLGMPKLEKQFQTNKQNNYVEILFVGRLESRKGIDVLLRAIPKVIQEITNVQFRIIGDNSLKNSFGKTYMEVFLENHQNSEIVNKVFFEGKVDQNELIKAYENCDIFVAPSKFESFGLIFLEAMRSSKAVIGCRTGGIPEIVENESNGFLVEPGNSEQLAEAMITLCRDSELRFKMGERGKLIFEEKFSVERMALESESIYKTAINNLIEI